MAQPRPHTQSELAENLEKWLGRRRAHEKLRNAHELAEWERDEIFLPLALQLWPVDMEAAVDPHYNTSSRMRLRLRWEGFRATADAKERLLALLQTAEFIRERMEADDG